MSNLDLTVRALVDAARADEPTAADRARVRAALAARLAVPVSGPTLHPPSSSGPALASTAPAGGLAKLIVAGVLVGGAGFGAGVLASRSVPPAVARQGVEAQALRRALTAEHALRITLPEAPAQARATGAPPELPSQPAMPNVEPPPPPPAQGAPSTIPQRPSAPATSAPPAIEAALEDVSALAPPPLDATSLIEETDLLRRAQTSLASGDAAGALARLDALGVRYPGGVLREERLAARVVALCAAGRDAEARQEAERFLLEAPLSIHAARVRASCAFAPPRDGPASAGHPPRNTQNTRNMRDTTE